VPVLVVVVFTPAVDLLKSVVLLSASVPVLVVVVFTPAVDLSVGERRAKQILTW
jgi:hypothetical protein